MFVTARYIQIFTQLMIQFILSLHYALLKIHANQFELKYLYFLNIFRKNCDLSLKQCVKCQKS